MSRISDREMSFYARAYVLENENQVQAKEQALRTALRPTSFKVETKPPRLQGEVSEEMKGADEELTGGRRGRSIP